MTDSDIEHISTLLGGPLDVSLEEVGAEWEHYLKSSLVEQLGEAGMYNQWFGPPLHPKVYYEFRITQPTIDSFLRVLPAEEGAQILIVGQSEAAVARNRELWLHAVESATQRMGSKHPEFPWYALMTCEPVFGSDTQVLSKGTVIGEMRIEPSGVTYWEYRPARATLDGLSLSWSSPVTVEGIDTGFNFHAAQLKAVQRVTRLRAMLSVVLDERWVIKLSPLDRKIRIPRSHPEMGPSKHPSDMQGHAHSQIEIPDWLRESWERAVHQADLTDALAMYQEALDVWHDHPSLALICLVGAVERIGARYQDLVRCEHCAAQVGSGKRFRAALSTVMSSEEAASLVKAYAPRSQTVHSGHLHGSEHTAGIAGLGLTQDDPISDFELGLVEDLRRAAQAILLRGLKDQLPEDQGW
jgi:hypothetical protein